MAKEKCSSENNGKNKGSIQSPSAPLGASGFAPAFGRAVGLDAELKLRSISKAKASATGKLMKVAFLNVTNDAAVASRSLKMRSPYPPLIVFSPERLH
jgi:hypothetical protein